MKTMKKKMTSAALAALLTLSAIAPTKDAKAGAIVAAVGSTVAMPVALGITAIFAGFGTSVASIYYAIAHRDKSWWCYLFFMLDADLNSEKMESLVSQRYPGLDASLVSEISSLILNKAQTTETTAEGVKDVILSESELAPVLSVLTVTNPELGTLIKQDLTQASAHLVK